MLLSAGDGASVFDLCQRDAGHTLLALNVHHGVAQLQRNAKIIEALHNIALQTAGIGHKLGNAEHLGTLQRHTARHNQADVAAAQNHNPPPGQVAFHIDKALRRARSEDTGGAVAGDVQRAAGRSRQPIARMTALGCSWNRPSVLFMAVTVLSAAKSSTIVFSL